MRFHWHGPVDEMTNKTMAASNLTTRGAIVTEKGHASPMRALPLAAGALLLHSPIGSV